MRALALTLALAVLLAGIAAYLWNQQETGPDISMRQEGRVDQTLGRKQTDAESSAPDSLVLSSSNANSGHVDQPESRAVFTDVDEATSTKLEPWLDEVYLPEIRFLVRHRLAAIDSSGLSSQLKESWDDFQVGGQSKTVELNLFADVIYEVAIENYSIGRAGHIHTNGRVIGPDYERSRVYIEVGPEGQVFASIKSPDNWFAVSPSTEYPYIVITESDKELSAQSVRFD